MRQLPDLKVFNITFYKKGATDRFERAGSASLTLRSFGRPGSSWGP
jgi:hypothetical protein